MEYFLGEYIEDSVQHEVLDTATNKAEYCQYRAAIIRNNCLTKFRGWDKGQIGEKSREKVLDSIINEKIFFSTALGYNDPYDTLLYVNKRSLLKFVGESLDREMSTYIAELKKKNFPMGCFAQMFWTPENREKFLQSIDDEIAAIKIIKVVVELFTVFIYDLNTALLWVFNFGLPNRSRLALIFLYRAAAEVRRTSAAVSAAGKGAIPFCAAPRF